MEQGFEISRGSSLTIITIPPKPYCDKTHWTVVDADDKTKVNAKTKITILIERVWWNAGDLNGALQIGKTESLLYLVRTLQLLVKSTLVEISP